MTETMNTKRMKRAERKRAREEDRKANPIKPNRPRPSFDAQLRAIAKAQNSQRDKN